MKRNSTFAALIAAALSLALAASLTGCGGGGGSDTQTASAGSTATGSTGSVSTVSDPGTGTKSGTGGTTPTAPGSTPDNGALPIPNCTPRQVIVALQGDTIMEAEFTTGRLQLDLDNHFGVGNVVVYNYALGGNLSADYLYISGDVIVSGYGIWDMETGVSPDVYAQHLKATGATIVVTQTPIVSALFDPTAYLAAASGTGIVVADAYTYVNSLVTAGTPLYTFLDTDGVHPLNNTAELIIDNVIAPAVFKQAAPLRCQLQ
jgi:hypothetical protein